MYASATPLMNGEIYIQGGRSGEDLPEVRQTDGTYRLLTGAPTGQYQFFYPRNFLTRDGRVFGFDVNGLMYYVTTDGAGSITPAGQLDFSLVSRPSTTVMYRPGRILQISGRNAQAVTIDINGPTPVVTPTASLSSRLMPRFSSGEAGRTTGLRSTTSTRRSITRPTSTTVWAVSRAGP